MNNVNFNCLPLALFLALFNIGKISTPYPVKNLLITKILTIPNHTSLQLDIFLYGMVEVNMGYTKEGTETGQMQ